MKLGAVFCVWGDTLDLLEKSIDNILPSVDHVFVIASKTSNHGLTLDYEIKQRDKVTIHWLEPNKKHLPKENECDKRNFGLAKAREAGMTHFVNLDGDEFYIREEFESEVKRIVGGGYEGSVCRLKVYISEPTLWCDDHTLVPFIHKITPFLRFQLEAKNYPFAYDTNKKAHIDPTRRLNLLKGVEMSDIYMHHFSYVRENMELKIQNSTAKHTLEKRRSLIYSELENAKEGYVSKMYNSPLRKSENLFNL